MDAQSRKTVLVVDDEDYLRDIWQEVLKLIDTDTISAESGEHAISILKENEIDMVITDLRMQGSNAFVLLDYLKNDTPEKIPTLICSGFYNECSDELSSFDITRVIPKPFNVREELSLLRDLLYG